jgi:hypothetical protein
VFKLVKRGVWDRGMLYRELILGSKFEQAVFHNCCEFDDCI